MPQSELVLGIIKHIRSGDSKETIAVHVQNAGYTAAEFERAYFQALTVITPGTVSADPVLDNVSPLSKGAVVGYEAFTTIAPLTNETGQPTAPVIITESSVPVLQSEGQMFDAPLVTVRSKLGCTPVLIVSIIMGMIFIGSGLAWAYNGFNTPSFVGSLFGNGPYQEKQLMQDIARGIQQIKASDVTVALSVEAVDLEDGVYLIPEQLDKELGYPYSVLSYLPIDFKVGGELTGSFTLGTSSPDTYTKMTGFYETPDMTMYVDIEFILSQLQGVFLRVNRLPSMMMFDLSAVKEQWLHLWNKPLSDTIANWKKQETQWAGTYEQVIMIIQKIDAHQVLVLESDPTVETISGSKAYKYTLRVNQDTLSSFIRDVKKSFDTTYGPQGHFLAALTDDDIALYSSSAMVNYINDHTTFELWARADGTPVQYAVRQRIAVDTDAIKNIYTSTETVKKMFINNQRATAEIFYTSKNSYKDFCTQSVARDNQYRKYELTCNDSTQAFAISMELEEGYFCADSTGFSGVGMVTSGGTACGKAAPGKTIDKPAPVPEHQINTTFLLTLNNVNNVTPVTIPQAAMTRAELIKKVPALQYMLPDPDREQSLRLNDNYNFDETSPSRPDQTLKEKYQNWLYWDIRGKTYSWKWDENNGSYEGVCTNKKVMQTLWDTFKQDNVTAFICEDTKTTLYIEADLPDGEKFCINRRDSGNNDSFEEGTACRIN